MKRRTIAWLVPVLMIAASTAGSDARDVVEIRLNGHFFSEPATVRFLVAVEPDEENRMLRIEADGPDMFRASEITLNGVNEKRLHAITFKNLAAGHYTLRAHVLSSTEVRGMATNEVTVTGVGLQ